MDCLSFSAVYNNSCPPLPASRLLHWKAADPPDPQWAELAMLGLGQPSPSCLPKAVAAKHNTNVNSMAVAARHRCLTPSPMVASNLQPRTPWPGLRGVPLDTVSCAALCGNRGWCSSRGRMAKGVVPHSGNDIFRKLPEKGSSPCDAGKKKVQDCRQNASRDCTLSRDDCK